MDDQPKHRGTVIMSVTLHAVVVGALTLGLRLPSQPPRSDAAPAPIQGMIVDESVLNKEIERRERAERAETQRKQREERQAREAVERERREKDAATKREQERVVQQQREKAAEAQREREKAAQAEKDKAAAAKREQERVAQERREKDARDQKAREETARKQKEAAAARERAQAESELQAQVAAENARTQAVRAGQLDEYIRLIANQIERNWVAPLSAKPGLDCLVQVVQIPSGDVMDVRVTRCNGDDAVIRSIEAAVRRSSPLPKPPSQAVFERNLNVTFRPQL